MKGIFPSGAWLHVYAPLVALLGLWGSVSSDAQARTWTRQNGDQFEADFVRCEGGAGGFVVLRKLNGLETTIRMWNLSEEDQQCVKQLALVASRDTKPKLPATQPNPAATPEPPNAAPQNTSQDSTRQPARLGRRNRVWWSTETADRVWILRPV
jgi:hypothetical protein